MLYYWNNDYITGLINENIVLVLPIIFLLLCEISKTHWNAQITALTQSVLKLLRDMNSKLYDEMVTKYKIIQNKLYHTTFTKQNWRISSTCLNSTYATLMHARLMHAGSC